MQNNYEFNLINPNFDKLGYVIAVADMNEKHDRSAPSNFHWKILKCRMIIFSNSSILACPDKNESKQVHVIFNKVGDDYDKINSLFSKFSLTQNGAIRKPTPAMFEMCFHYTMTAKLAPAWNTLGYNYLINNRDFLTANGPQDGLRYHLSANENVTVLRLKPVKIHVMRSDEDFQPGECIRVFPSLNKAMLDECNETMPTSGSFKSYKDLRRHWKNIHGYRLPEVETAYCRVQFWQGNPLTYPRVCVTRNFPIITPLPKPVEKNVLSKFFDCLRNKMASFLGVPLEIQHNYTEDVNNVNNVVVSHSQCPSDTQAVSLCPSDTQAVSLCPSDTQAVSLCTPTQGPRSARR